MNKAGEVGGGPGHSKKFGFPPGLGGKALKGLKQGSDKIGFIWSFLWGGVGLVSRKGEGRRTKKANSWRSEERGLQSGEGERQGGGGWEPEERERESKMAVVPLGTLMRANGRKLGAFGNLAGEGPGHGL